MFKSKIKKGLVALLTGSMVIGSMILPAGAASSYTATGIFSDSTWNWGTFGVVAHKGDAKVTDFGTYTVTINSNDLEKDNKVSNANAGKKSADGFIFCVDVKGYAKALQDQKLNINNCVKGDDGKFHIDKDATSKLDIEVKDVKVAVDGKSMTVDQSKIIFGDIEEKGNFRIELRNEYGATKEAPAIDYKKVQGEKIAVTFTIAKKGAASETTKTDTTKTDATTAPAATATAAPTADSTKKTGDVSLAVVYGALVVCAGGLVVANLRRKESK
ncbi:MAG: hypothetical protein Q4G58_13940 [bacterium]|nr:hypothetical protein [bacterium]